MYKFLLRPKWIAFHLLVIAMVVIMINLAIWQVHRLQQRSDFNDQVRANQSEDIRPFNAVLTKAANIDDIEWLPVSVQGEYVAGTELTLVNVSQYGTAGVDLLAVMTLADGTQVLVNRGFVPLALEPPPTPTGTQTVIGYLRRSAQHRAGSVDNATEGTLTEIQRIDIPRLDEQIDGDLAPMYVQSLTDTNVAPFPVAPPVLENGPHLSYAIQWCIFSICAIGGWVLVVSKATSKLRAA